MYKFNFIFTISIQSFDFNVSELFYSNVSDYYKKISITKLCMSMWKITITINNTSY